MHGVNSISVFSMLLSVTGAMRDVKLASYRPRKPSEALFVSVLLLCSGYGLFLKECPCVRSQSICLTVMCSIIDFKSLFGVFVLCSVRVSLVPKVVPVVIHLNNARL